MLRSVFASNRPIVLLGLLVPALAAMVLALRCAEAEPIHLAGPAFDLLHVHVLQHPWLSVSLGALTLLLGGLLCNSIYNEHEFAERINYLPALVYVLFGLSNPTWLYFNPVLLANVLILLSIRRLLRIYRIANATSMLFDAGVFMGLAVLVYPPMALVLPFLWVGMTQLRSSSFREWLLPMAGLLVPVVYTAAAYWYYDFMPNIIEFTTFEEHFGLRHQHQSTSTTVFNILLLMSVLIGALGIVSFITSLGSSTVHRKNTRKSFLWLSFFLALVYIYVGFLSDTEGGFAGILLLPISVLSAKWYSGERRKILISLPFYLWCLLVLVHLLMFCKS